MRIGFICNEYPPGPHGGIGSYVQVVAKALAAAGHQVRVIGMYTRDYPAPDEEDDDGVQVWRLRRRAHRFGWVDARMRLYRAVARWAAQGKIDLVELPDWQGWAAGWPRLPVPVVSRLHGSSSYFAAEMQQSINQATFALERASLRRADFLCSSSHYTAARTQQIFGLPAGPHAIIYNPTAVRLPGSRRSRNRVVFSGTLHAKKGIVKLFEAWPHVARQCPWAELHVYGRDGLTSAGNSMQQTLTSSLPKELVPSVTFHGHVSRRQHLALFETARVSVFPSYVEAFAMAPMEAMASACPTIYTWRGSGPELIADGVHGLLVDPDRPLDIAHGIVRVLTDDALAERLGAAGHERLAREFSLPTVIAQNEAFYQLCLQAFCRDHRQAG